MNEIKSIINILVKYDNYLSIGVRCDDFEKSNFKENIEHQNKIEDEDEEEDVCFTLNEQDEKYIIIYYYSLFRDKNKDIIPEKSEEYLKIVNYFTMKNINKKVEELHKNIETDIKKFYEEIKKKQNKINEISKRLNYFYVNVSKESLKPINIRLLDQYINNSINILRDSKYFHIPFIGVSNSGKSTILNTLIGYPLLPVYKNEGTKKGILIKHWNYSYLALRRTYFRAGKTLNNETYYYFEPEPKEIAIGVKDIQRTLKASNYEFSNNEDDFFFEINLNIKFINELNLDDDLKEKICFIDLPGYGTNNKFEERGIYQNLVKYCYLFIFVTFNLTMKESNNQIMLNNLIKEITRIRGITTRGFLKKCLFIVNSDKNQKISEKTLNQAKSDILEITSYKKDKDFKDINISFFNAKLYENYLLKVNYYQSRENIIQTEYKEYKKLKSKYFKGFTDYIASNNFTKFLLKKLKDNIKEDIVEKEFEEKKVTPNEGVEKSIKDMYDYYSLKFKPKDLNLIAKYITFGNENITNSDLKFESRYDDFKITLYKFIKEAKLKEDKDINENLIKCFKILNSVFDVDSDTKFGKLRQAPIDKIIKPHMEKDLENMKSDISKYLNLINKEFTDNDVTKIIFEGEKKILNSLIMQKSYINQNLKNKDLSKILNESLDIFKKGTREIKQNLLNSIKSSSKKIKNIYDEFYNKLAKIYLKPCERKNQPYENYISQSFGGENKIETIFEDLISDIIKALDTIKEYKSGFLLGWAIQEFIDKNYLNRVIDCIISNLIPKIKSFCDSITNYSSSYKKIILDEIEASKGRIESEMEERKKKEAIEVKLINEKNEEEKKKWLEEKKIYESNIQKWKEMCIRYKELRDEIYEIRLTSL